MFANEVIFDRRVCVTVSFVAFTFIVLLVVVVVQLIVKPLDAMTFCNIHSSSYSAYILTISSKLVTEVLAFVSSISVFVRHAVSCTF